MFIAHSLIAGDGAFAVVLAAWWQLRRSAHLLPHLRRGPRSFFFNPGHGFLSWMMIITLQSRSTIRRPRRMSRQVAVDDGRVVWAAGVPDGPNACDAAPERELGRGELSSTTVPIPVVARLRRVSQPAPPPTPQLMTRGPAVELPTCPFPVVRARSAGHAALPIGPLAGPPRGENEPELVEPPIRRAPVRRGPP
ncbi:MAG TPA: hypothetical protein VGE11_02415 [Pseudonocardia sp.]